LDTDVRRKPGRLVIRLILENRPEQEPQEMETSFLNGLVDQQLPLEQERRYGDLRRLIAPRAFARSAISRRRSADVSAGTQPDITLLFRFALPSPRLRPKG